MKQEEIAIEKQKLKIEVVFVSPPEEIRDALKTLIAKRRKK